MAGAPHRPREIDGDRPSVARVWDYLRGGARNFAADRSFVRDEIRKIFPDAHQLPIAHTRFLSRAMKFVIDQGINQVIDIGAGTSSPLTTYAVPLASDQNCRLLLVDHEAVAVEALQTAISGDRRLAVLSADVREPDAIVTAPTTTELIDLSRPVVIVMSLLLHFIPESDDPARLLARYRELVAPGSYLILSHDTADEREDDMRRLVDLYDRHLRRTLVLRDRDAIRGLLDGYTVLDPGVVRMAQWRPEPDEPDTGPPERSCVYVALART